MKTSRYRLKRRCPQLESLEGRTLLSFGYGGVMTLATDTTSVDAEPADMAKDGAGNHYLTGYFQGVVDFDPANAHAGNTDILSSPTYIGSDGNPHFNPTSFVAKYTSDGVLAWALSGTGGKGIAVDTAGEVYACGGNAVVKLDANGTTLWAKAATDAGGDDATDLALDSAGNIVTTVGTALIKFDPSGNVVWKETIAGAGAVAIDASNRIHLTGGFTGSTDFDPGKGKYNMSTARGKYDAYLLVLDANGSFVRALDLPSFGTGIGITVDSSGNDYIAGGAAVAVKINAANKVVWTTKVPGGTSTDAAWAIAVDDSGAVYVTGMLSLSGQPSQEAFVWKLDGNTGQFLQTTYFGPGEGMGKAIVVEGTGTIRVAGWFQGTVDFDPTSGTDIHSGHTIGTSIFVVQLTS
jgi:streptogramin lyase